MRGAPGARAHLAVGAAFLALGAAAFALRSRLAWPALLGVEPLDALGTLCWAGVLTTCVSLLLRRTRRWRPWTWVISAAVSIGVELLQATPYPAHWAAVFPPAHLVFGSSFSAADLPWYLVGVAAAWWLLSRGSGPTGPRDHDGAPPHEAADAAPDGPTTR